MAKLPADDMSGPEAKEAEDGFCELCIPLAACRSRPVVAVGCPRWGNGHSLSWNLSYWLSKEK